MAEKLRLEWVEAGSLEDNPENWRTHPEEQVRAIKNVLDDPEVGWAGACLFNERTRKLLDGHARKNAVDPKTLVPVLIGDWSPEAEAKIMLTLDPIAMMAQQDSERMQALLAKVPQDDVLGLLLGEMKPKEQMGLMPKTIERPPTMSWVLVGIPTARFAEIADKVEEFNQMDGVFCEVSLSDG